MGLLDSVLGAVTGQNTGANVGAHAGGGTGLSSIITLVTNNPQLMQAAIAMLGNDGAHGGLGGLVAKFQQAGMGDVIGSWVGSGHNQAISGDQLSHVLGGDTVKSMAAQVGIQPADLAAQLSNMLPGLVDHLTPQGQMPSGGLGNSGDLMGVLGGLLRR